MRRPYFIAAILLLCGVGAIPARAQIVSYMDESGRRVYINANSGSASREASTAPKPATASASKTATANGSSATPSFSNRETSEPDHQAIETMIHEVSARYQVDPALIRAVIQTESNWNPTAVSTKGAQGLMQLVPTTAQQMGVDNAFDPKQNLDGGVHYLGMLLQRYNGDLDKTLAAYNAGPGAVDRAGGVPRYKETRDYVQKVTAAYNQPAQADPLTSPSRVRAQPIPVPHPIYRTTSADGRVIFTNE